MFPFFAARCSGVLPAVVFSLIVTAVSCDSFDLAAFRALDSSLTDSVGFSFEAELLCGFAGVNTNDLSQVGHGTVCPVPSAGYSMDCPQCGHSLLRKSLINFARASNLRAHAR